MGKLTREKLGGIKDIQIQSVLIPEWTDTDGSPMEAFVRGMTALERDEYEQSLVTTTVTDEATTTRSDFSNAKARAVAKCLVNEDGSKLFDSEAEGAAWLGARAAGPINRLFTKIQDLSGMSRKAEKKLEKNSDAV